MVAAKPITCYFELTTLLYSITQIFNTQFQHPIIYIEFVVHPLSVNATGINFPFCNYLAVALQSYKIEIK